MIEVPDTVLNMSKKFNSAAFSRNDRCTSGLTREIRNQVLAEGSVNMTILLTNGETTGGKEKLHMVVLPYPAKGHSIPLLHFAKRLHSMGITVTFVNTFNHMTDEHFRTLDGLDSSMRVVSLGTTPQEGEGKGTLPYVNHVNDLVGETEDLMQKLIVENPSAPPASIISDMFLGWTQVVAEKFKIPRYVLFASPGSALATHLHGPELVRQGRLPILDTSNLEELVNDIPGVPPTRMADLPSPMQDHTDYLYPFYMRNAEQMHEAAGVLINTYYELEPFCIDVLRRTVYGDRKEQVGQVLSMLPVGPMLPSVYFSALNSALDNLEGKDPCLQWLDKQPDGSTLYVSFGSVAILSLTQLHELALGLEASGQRFLLVVRSTQDADSLLPEGFEERTKERGFVVNGWAPQLWVLSHASVGGFLTHCGWNSSLESICRGVPMLTWPIQAEQAMNARFLVDEVKAAVEVHKDPRGFVSTEEVARAVRSLMTEPAGQAARSNVEKLRELALNAVAKGGSAENNLQKFIAEVKSWRHADSTLPLLQTLAQDGA